jgi:hypothetical protein
MMKMAFIHLIENKILDKTAEPALAARLQAADSSSMSLKNNELSRIFRSRPRGRREKN